jgi:hypothetical protein
MVEDQMELHEVKSFCTQKKCSLNGRDHPQNGRKIFAIYTSDKGLITRIYKGAQKTKLPKNQ